MSWFIYATWEHFDAFRALDRWEPAQIDAWPGTAARSRKRPTAPGWGAGRGARPTAGGELLYAGTGVVDGRGAVLLATSTDEARSRQVAGTVLFQADFTGEHQQFHEPHVAELAGGELLCILRTDNGAPGIHSCRSGDRGRTWSPPEPTGMIGFDQPDT